MPVDQGYLDHVKELLSPIDGVTYRAMFGGYGIFHDGDMFALISGSTLYFKVSDANRESYEEAGSNQFSRMPYYEVPANVMEDENALQGWATDAIVIGHAIAKKKR